MELVCGYWHPSVELDYQREMLCSLFQRRASLYGIGLRWVDCESMTLVNENEIDLLIFGEYDLTEKENMLHLAKMEAESIKVRLNGSKMALLYGTGVEIAALKDKSGHSILPISLKKGRKKEGYLEVETAANLFMSGYESSHYYLDFCGASIGSVKQGYGNDGYGGMFGYSDRHVELMAEGVHFLLYNECYIDHLIDRAMRLKSGKGINLHHIEGESSYLAKESLGIRKRRVFSLYKIGCTTYW